jgi:hypothetical protein
MFMGMGFLSDIQQSGSQGGDTLYSTNWFMGSAEHRVGSNGAFEVDLMLSLEPATIIDRRYPCCSRQAKRLTAFHWLTRSILTNFIMFLGFHYTRQLAEDATLDLYFAPVGDPALGPVAAGSSSSSSSRGGLGTSTIAENVR